MFPNRHHISIEEISYEEYCNIKKFQELKIPEKPLEGVIYGVIIEGISTGVGNFAKGLNENLKDFRRIKILKPKKEKGGEVFQKRRKIYVYHPIENTEEIGYENTKQLERMIQSGRGLDVQFKGQDTELGSERHFYRLFNNNLVLVEAHIPFRVISENIYQFRRSSNEDYLQLRATSKMPLQEIAIQSLQRKNL